MRPQLLYTQRIRCEVVLVVVLPPSLRFCGALPRLRGRLEHKAKATADKLSSKGWHDHNACSSHRPGGEPLARDPTTTLYLYQRVVGPHRVKAGGSRELPSAMQLYGLGVSESKPTCVYIALRRFREPLVFIFFQRDKRRGECRKGGGSRAKAAPLQAMGGRTRQ